jgi:hypothetical protein
MTVHKFQLQLSLRNLHHAAEEVLNLANSDESRGEAWEEELEALDAAVQDAWDMLLESGYTWKNANEKEN